MSLSSVQAFFQSLQLDIPILETEANTATVLLAVAAHGVEPGRIAKTLAFRLSDGRDVLVVARGDARIDNLKFKSIRQRQDVVTRSGGRYHRPPGRRCMPIWVGAAAACLFGCIFESL